MTKNKLVPKLRFKEFKNTDAWEQRKLGDEVENIGTGRSNFITSIERSSETPYAVLGSTSVISYDKEFDHSGDFILTARVGANAGNLYKHSGDVKISDNTVYIQSKSLNFAYYLLKKFDLKRLSFGTGQPLVKASELKNLKLMFPKDKEEQAEIGVFFAKLDDTIALHQRKLEKMKSLKEAYLSEMFPTEGKKKPKRRFKGFTDDWEQRKLGEYTKLITKGTTPRNRTGNGKINFIKVENLSNGKINPVMKIDIEEHEGYLKRSRLEVNDILFSIAGTLGRTAVVSKTILPANTNQALSIIRDYDFDTDFLISSLSGYVVAEYIRKNPTVGAQPNLSLEQVGKLEISSPSKQEQQKIGAFFKQLDDTIALHQHKLEKLQNLKKAYLNEMFV